MIVSSVLLKKWIPVLSRKTCLERKIGTVCERDGKETGLFPAKAKRGFPDSFQDCARTGAVFRQSGTGVQELKPGFAFPVFSKATTDGVFPRDSVFP